MRGEYNLAAGASCSCALDTAAKTVQGPAAVRRCKEPGMCLVMDRKLRLKGGEAKTRPHETLTNANFKVLYRNK